MRDPKIRRLLTNCFWSSSKLSADYSATMEDGAGMIFNNVKRRESSSHEQAPFIATTHTCSHPPALLLGRNVTDTGRVLLMASLLSCAIVQFVPGAGQCGHCHFIFSQIRRGDEGEMCPRSGHLQFSQLDNHRIPAATSTSTTAYSLLTGYC